MNIEKIVTQALVRRPERVRVIDEAAILRDIARLVGAEALPGQALGVQQGDGATEGRRALRPHRGAKEERMTRFVWFKTYYGTDIAINPALVRSALPVYASRERPMTALYFAEDDFVEVQGEFGAVVTALGE